MNFDGVDWNQLEEKFSAASNTVAGAENILIELKNYFKNNKELDKKYRFTLFRWYVFLTWKRLFLVPREEIAEVVSRQAPMAALLGFDIKDDLLDYFSFRCPGDTDKKEIFTKIKDVLTGSTAYVGSLDNKVYILRDIVEMVKNKNQDSSSLEKIEKIMFPDNDVSQMEYINSDRTVSVQNLVSFIEIFLNQTSENIGSFVESYLAKNDKNVKTTNIEVKMPTSKELGKNKEKQDVNTEVKQDQPMKIIDKLKNLKKDDRAQMPDNSRAGSVVAPQALLRPSVAKKSEPIEQIIKKKLSYKEIRRRIESSFGKDKTGNFADISAVLGELQKISSDQGDPRVKDLFFFNEQTGNFEWNEKMFNE